MFGFALKGQRGRIMLALALTISATAFELLRPWPFKFVLDEVLIPVTGGQSLGRSETVVLVAAAIALFVIPVATAIFKYRATLAAVEVGKKATLRIRRHVFEHLHRLSLRFHDASRSGDLLTRLMGDVDQMRNMLFESWLRLAERGLLFLGLAIALVLINPLIALAALGPLPFLLFRVSRGSKELHQVVRKQRRRHGRAAALANETLQQIRVVKAFSAEAAASEQFGSDARDGERQAVKAAKIAAKLGLFTEAIAAFGGAGVVVVGALQVVAGDLTTGELIVVVAYARSLYKPVRKISSEGLRLSKATAVAERLAEVLRIKPEDSDIGSPAPRFEGRIEFRDVTFAHDDGHQVLDGASFSLPAGSLAVLTGENGAGKSTVLSLLLRLHGKQSGEIRVDDQPIESFQLQSYRNRIAYGPQELLLFSGTVKENILFGRPEATHAEIIRAVRIALFDMVAERLPDGLETELGERGTTLSGGEARRLILARAAVRDADLLLLDEPLAGLDPPARLEVAESVRRIAAGRTTIVVSHDMLAEIDPDVVLRIEADGTVHQSDPGYIPDEAVGEGRPW